MKKRIGVILSGCGVQDGSEIHEAVLTLLAIDNAGAEAVCLAPDIDQHHVINHLTGKIMEDEKRNVLVESARIARGRISDIRDAASLDLNGLIFPGGSGAAKNLSDFAFRGAECSVLPEVAEIVREFYRSGKPLGFICIAPAIAAAVLGDEGIELTIGDDPKTAAKLEAMGARHVTCTVRDTCVGSKGNIVTTPAYMLGPSIGEVAKGIEKLVQEVLASS